MSPVAETIAVGKALNVPRAEEIVAESVRWDAHTHVELDLSGTEHIDVGAGWRLGNALSRARGGADLLVHVADPEAFRSSLWFRNYTRSGLGLAVAAYAARVTAGSEDITDAMRDYYSGRGRRNAQNSLIFPYIEDGSLTADEDRFSANFRRWVADVSNANMLLNQRDWRAVVKLSYEAIKNVVEHAYRVPHQGAKGLSYFGLRYYKQVSAPPGEAFAAYLRRVRAWQAQESAGGEIRWAEIVVNDDGVGIAARQSLRADVYLGEIEGEDDALRDAIEAASTVKEHVLDAPVSRDPGYGYTHIFDSLLKLRGYAELRTGRRRAILTPSPDGSAGGFMIDQAELGWMPGTTLQVVFPLLVPQLRLDI